MSFEEKQDNPYANQALIAAMLQGGLGMLNASQPNFYGTNTTGNILTQGLSGFAQGYGSNLQAQNQLQQQRSKQANDEAIARLKQQQMVAELAKSNMENQRMGEQNASISRRAAMFNDPTTREEYLANPNAFAQPQNPIQTQDGKIIVPLVGGGYREMYTNDFGRMMELAEAKSPKTNVTVGTQPEFEKEYGKLGAQYLNGLADQALAAEETLPNIDSMMQLLDSGYKTGMFAETAAAVGALGNAFGFDTSKWGMADPTSAQQFQSGVMKNLLAELVKQKGPQTEGDAARAMKTYAQMGNTPEANRWILQYARNLQQRSIDRYNFIAERMMDNGGNRYQAEREWQEYLRSLPSALPASSTDGASSLQDMSDEELLGGL